MEDLESKGSITMLEHGSDEPKIVNHEYHHGDDVAFKILGDSNIQHDAVTPEEEKVVSRRVAWHILPLVWLVYGLQYADKAALGYAALFGILTDLQLEVVHGKTVSTTRYSNVSMIVSVGIIAGSFTLAPLAQKWPGKFMAGTLTAWGIIASFTPLCKNYAGIMVQRALLGYFEGGVYPAALQILSMWFLKKEQAFFTPVINSAPTFFSILFALLSWGVVTIGPAAHAWRMIFIFIGPITVVYGIILFFILPDSPVTARWLTPRQKYVAVERLRENQAGVINKTFKPGQAAASFLDIKVIVLLGMAFCAVSPSAAVGSFGGLVIKQLYGATGRRSLLLNMPASAIGGVLGVAGGYGAMKFKNSRILICNFYTLLVMIGTLLQWRLPLTERGGLLAGVWLAAIYSAAYSQVIGLAVSNTSGSSKKSVIAAALYSSAGLAGVAGPFYFAGNQAPRYALGFKVTTIIACIGLGLNSLYGVLCFIENKRRSKLPPAEVDHAFDDMSDTQNMAFRYVY